MNLEIAKRRLMERAREVVVHSMAANRASGGDGSVDPCQSSPSSSSQDGVDESQFRNNIENTSAHLIARAREAVQSIAKRDFSNHSSTSNPSSTRKLNDPTVGLDHDDEEGVDESQQLRLQLEKLQKINVTLEEENDELRDQCQAQRDLLTELSKKFITNAGCDNESALKQMDENYLPLNADETISSASDAGRDKLQQQQAKTLEKEREQLLQKITALETELNRLKQESAAKDSEMKALKEALQEQEQQQRQQNNMSPQESFHGSKLTFENGKHSKIRVSEVEEGNALILGHQDEETSRTSADMAEKMSHQQWDDPVNPPQISRVLPRGASSSFLIDDLDLILEEDDENTCTGATLPSAASNNTTSNVEPLSTEANETWESGADVEECYVADKAKDSDHMMHSSCSSFKKENLVDHNVSPDRGVFAPRASHVHAKSPSNISVSCSKQDGNSMVARKSNSQPPHQEPSSRLLLCRPQSGVQRSGPALVVASNHLVGTSVSKMRFL